MVIIDQHEINLLLNMIINIFGDNEPVVSSYEEEVLKEDLD